MWTKFLQHVQSFLHYEIFQSISKHGLIILSAFVEKVAHTSGSNVIS